MDSGREKRWSLDGATALVTGGARGIGYSLYKSLLLFFIYLIYSMVIFYSYIERQDIATILTRDDNSVKCHF